MPAPCPSSMSAVSSSNLAGLDRLAAVSADNTDLTLCLSLSYGGREELAAAAAAVAGAVAAGVLPAASLADPSVLRRFLPHADVIPDPDLLLRTSGELASRIFYCGR
jgi:undecaprenyl diphosphate synthase